MSKTVRVVVASLGVLGAAAVATRKAGMWGDNRPGTSSSVSLPVSCRVRGHGWRTSGRVGQAPTRRTCQKCQRIDLPTP